MASPELIAWIALLGFGSLQGIFLAVLLAIHPTGPRAVNRWLAALILIVSALLANAVIMHLLEGWRRWPDWIFVLAPGWFLIGPLLLVYVRSLVRDRLQVTWLDLLHLVPLVVPVVDLVPFWAQSQEFKTAWMETTLQPLATPFTWTWANIHRTFLFPTVTLGYVTACGVMVWRYRVRFKETRSDALLGRVDWLMRLLVVFALFLLAAIFVGLLEALNAIEPMRRMTYGGMVILSGVAHVVAYMAIRHPNVLFADGRVKELPATRPAHTAPPDGLTSQLLEVMQVQRPHLNPDLRLADLAGLLSVPPRVLSRLFSAEGTTFYDYVNGFRVEEVKERLAARDLRDLTILGIALESGFSSKASFNRIFKKHNGMTPSAYVRAMAESPPSPRASQPETGLIGDR